MKKLLTRLKLATVDLSAGSKSAEWKLAVAAGLKAKTTVTNRWLATAIKMGNLHEVSRKVAAWNREPNVSYAKKLGLTPKPKA